MPGNDRLGSSAALRTVGPTGKSAFPLRDAVDGLSLALLTPNRKPEHLRSECSLRFVRFLMPAARSCNGLLVGSPFTRAGLQSLRRGPFAPLSTRLPRSTTTDPGRTASTSHRTFRLQSPRSRFAFPRRGSLSSPPDPRSNCAHFPLTPSGNSPVAVGAFSTHPRSMASVERGCVHVKPALHKRPRALDAGRGHE